jgi:hypothetical protein
MKACAGQDQAAHHPGAEEACIGHDKRPQPVGSRQHRLDRPHGRAVEDRRPPETPARRVRPG